MMKRRDFLKLAAITTLGVTGVPALTAEPMAVLNVGEFLNSRCDVCTERIKDERETQNREDDDNEDDNSES